MYINMREYVHSVGRILFYFLRKKYMKKFEFIFSVTGYVNVEFYNVYKVKEMGGI